MEKLKKIFKVAGWWGFYILNAYLLYLTVAWLVFLIFKINIFINQDFVVIAY